MTSKLIIGLLVFTTIAAVTLQKRQFFDFDEPSYHEERLASLRAYLMKGHHERKELPIHPSPERRWFETAAEAKMKEGYAVPYDVPMPDKRLYRSQSDRDQLHSDSLKFLILLLVPVAILTFISVALKGQKVFNCYQNKKRWEKYYKGSTDDEGDEVDLLKHVY